MDARAREYKAGKKYNQLQDSFDYVSKDIQNNLEILATARANLIDAVASIDRHDDKDPAQYVIEYDNATAKHAKACDRLAEIERKLLTAEKQLRRCQEETIDLSKAAENSETELRKWRTRINHALKTPEQKLKDAIYGADNGVTTEAALLTTANNDDSDTEPDPEVMAMMPERESA